MPVIRMTAVNAGGGVYHPPAIPMQIDAISEVTAINIACSSSDSAFNIAANSSGHTIISENGSVIDSVLTTQLLSINITGDSAGTTTVDFTGGDPLPTSGLSIDSGQLDITGSSGSDSLFTTATAAVFGDAEIRHPATAGVTFLNAGPGDQIIADAGTVTVAGDNDLIVLDGNLISPDYSR